MAEKAVELNPMSEQPSQPMLFDNLSDLMTVEEVATFLRKHPKTVQGYIAKRTIPFVENGNRYMILKDSLREWLKRKEFNPWQSQR